jgi:hypothetical protein
MEMLLTFTAASIVAAVAAFLADRVPESWVEWFAEVLR